MTSRSGLRRSIDDRLRHLAAERRVDANRLRRHLVFERMLVRLGRDQRWVLKGGFALELRMPTSARATKDLDLALRDGSADVEETLAHALEGQMTSDGFGFTVDATRAVSPDEAGNPGWRLTVSSSLEGEPFQVVTVDVVARPDEIAGGIEELLIPPLLALPGFRPTRVPAVDVHQHAAEKFHALARRYAGDRPSSRVKDLVDLVLLIEAGVLRPERVFDRVVQVYRVRDGVEAPTEVPELPTAWQRTFPAMAADVGLSTTSCEAAQRLITQWYADSVTSRIDPHPLLDEHKEP